LHALSQSDAAPRAGGGALTILADPVFAADDPRLAGAPTRASGNRQSAPPDAEPLRRLPWSGREAERIAELFADDRVRLRLGFEAGADNLAPGALGDAELLHIATHSVVNDRHPELSGLALSAWTRDGRAREGFLGLPKIFELELDADLVTLSACRTALGQSLRGEGLLGLSQGFFAAGARRVLVSLWDVDDRATSEWMGHFYTALAGGAGPTEAVSVAHRQMRRDPRWAAPFYWAGFVLMGDPR
ncbi:MAG: CHAT domain-containing protein, partial [Acidobacteriota bacterium]